MNEISTLLPTKPSSVLSWHYRLLATLIRGAYIVLPSQAPKWVATLWFTPFTAKTAPHIKQWQKTADQCYQLDHGPVFVWGNEGPLIVAMHGWRGSGWQFRRFIEPLLKQGYRLALFDAPAHGSSQQKRTHLYQFVDVLEQINREIGPIESMIGHSLGCAAISLAAQTIQPKKVAFISGNFDIESMFRQFCNHLGLPRGLQDRVRLAIIDYCNQNIFAGSYETFSRTVMAEKLRGIPAQFCYDVNDPELDMSGLTYLQEALGAEKHTIDNVGHFAILKSAKVVDDVCSFITSPDN
ncbi:MAG: alpha/beta fold hydrolase [Arenicella sp.]